MAPDTSTPNLHRPYIIYREPPGWGFWSNFVVVLQGLDEADRKGLLPVVDMERYVTRYNEEEPVNGTANAWEYYFEQPTDLTLAKALTLDPLDSGGLVKDDPFTTVFAQISPNPETLLRGRELIRKYVRVKPEIQQRVDALITREAGGRTVGVHVRGTDQRHGRFPDHPASALPAAYLDQVIMLDEEHSFNSVFLATDEQEAVDMFAQHFGSRLLTIPAHRTGANHAATEFRQGYTWLFGASERRLHKYHLGLEVLIDALLLSRCSHLVCGASNVSHAAMYFANDDQRVHPVPPLWVFSDVHHASRGKAYLSTLPPPTYKPSAAVLEQNIKEFEDIVEFLENKRAETQHRVIQLAEAEGEAQRHLALARSDNEQLRATVEDLHSRLKDLTSLHGQLVKAHDHCASEHKDLLHLLKTTQQALSTAQADANHLNATVAGLKAEVSAYRRRFVVRLADALARMRRRIS